MQWPWPISKVVHMVLDFLYEMLAYHFMWKPNQDALNP